MGENVAPESHTDLAYLANNCTLTTNATVLQFNKGESHTLVLDRTIFHPQGGGQPSDVGVIEGSDGRIFVVERVSIDKNSGCVIHTGKSTESFEVGSSVELRVSEEARSLHTRLHSAGHLLDLAVQRLGYAWKAEKGFHFAEGPYNEYSAEVTVCQELEKKNEEAKKAILEEVEKIQLENPSVYTQWTKSEKSKGDAVSCWDQRLLCFGESHGLCAGTHVKEAKHVFCFGYLKEEPALVDQQLTVRKIQVKSKKGTIKLSYSLSAIS